MKAGKKCAYTSCAMALYAHEVSNPEEVVAQPDWLWAKQATAVGFGSWWGWTLLQPHAAVMESTAMGLNSIVGDEIGTATAACKCIPFQASSAQFYWP